MRFLLYMSLLLPLQAFAVNVAAPTDFKSFLNILNGIIAILIPFIFALTFLAITWGVIRAWIMGDASSDDIDKGKKTVVVGIIVLTLMASIWGILRLLQAGLFA